MEKRRDERARPVGLRHVLACMLALALLSGTMPVYGPTVRAWGDEPGAESMPGAASAAEDTGPSNEGDVARPASSVQGTAQGLADTSHAGDASEGHQHAVERLAALRAGLAESLDALASARSRFEKAHAALPRKLFAGDVALEARESMQERTDELARSRKNASGLLRAVQEELAKSDEYNACAILAGIATSRELELRQDMLERLVIAECARIRGAFGEQRRLRVSIAIDAVTTFHERREFRATARTVNGFAYEVERRCAQARQCICDVHSAAEAVRDGDAASHEAEEDALVAADDALSIVGEAEHAIGSWYDEVDAGAGLEGGISFGEGMGFLMPEEVFVETWGAAIDAFFAQNANGALALPLQGYGRTMASSAYRHKVDPRLCAAVSIAESGGGQNCIRPYNAWGWGAADEDPYGLAAEWGSFEEAIEAWHEGMAASTSGLASAPTVSALGAIYCSSPAWGATVVEQMESISGFA